MVCFALFLFYQEDPMLTVAILYKSTNSLSHLNVPLRTHPAQTAWPGQCTLKPHPSWCPMPKHSVEGSRAAPKYYTTTQWLMGGARSPQSSALPTKHPDNNPGWPQSPKAKLHHPEPSSRPWVSLEPLQSNDLFQVVSIHTSIHLQWWAGPHNHEAYTTHQWDYNSTDRANKNS